VEELEDQRMKIETITVYRTGYSNGYTHAHSGPLFRTYADAKAYGVTEHGAYAVDPMPFEAIDDGMGGAYLVGERVVFIEQLERDRDTRQKALEKLNPAERRVLGIKDVL
jgi:hypothetical protein